MTPINYPASLPCFRWEPYSVSPRPGSIEETLGMITYAGRVYTANNEVVNVELVLDATDEPTFRTFYKTTLSMGTQWFNGNIQRNGTLEATELLFIGGPPVFTPIAHNVVRASFTLLTRGEPLPEPVYELTATQAVNIAATSFKLSVATIVPGGTIVTINTLSTDRLVITKPTIAADPALTWDAWSPFATDSGSGDGLSWVNAFTVSDQSDALVLLFTTSPVKYATVSAAQAAAAAGMPIQLTGHTAYQFWHHDTPTNDNRRGLSLRVETYSIVP